MIFIYLILLFIAPQLWIEPFIGIRVDFFLYPVWALLLVLNGKIVNFFKFNTVDYFFIMMILWIIITGFVAEEKNSMTYEVMFRYFKFFILYRFISIDLVNQENVLSTINKMVFVVSIVVIEAIQHKYFSSSGLGWAGQQLGWVDASVIEAGGSGRTQWVNIFDGPGVFCVMFTLILPFVIYYFDISKTMWKKISSLLLLVLICLAIWTTGSRGGLLATLSIFSFFIMFKVKVSFFTIIKVGALLAVLVMLAPSHLTQTKDANNSAQYRVDMWGKGVEMVESNPIFGVGKFNFKEYSGFLIAHNSSIEIMGELGFPGLFLWLGLIYLTFKTLYLYPKYDENANIVISNGLLISLVGYLVSSFFVTLEYETLYFMLGIVRSLCNQAGMEVKLSKQDFYNVAGMTLGLYIVMKIFISLYY